ncbi:MULTISPECIES: hypothetical protein [Streptomyces]|uniref:hypothetical protein n=1 Tax=Streptomyces lycopersici TaxID=2974589 RepID=UPI0021D011A4|nr:hypothetical protein [Streptomyces sp. NEAU-383]
MSSNTAVRTVRRRTLRVAAAVLIAAAGFSLTACNDSDANASKPAASATSSSADSSTGGKGTDAKAGAGAGTETKAGNGAGTEDKAGAADEASSPDRTETLADGSTGEIYELGDQEYRLKIVNDGDVLATFETNGQDAGLDANGMYVVLTRGGEVKSWMGGEHKAPGTFELEGWTAKVTKVGESHYRAEIIGNGDVMGTMEANGHDAGLNANGVYIVLSTRGVISAHE